MPFHFNTLLQHIPQDHAGRWQQLWYDVLQMDAWTAGIPLKEVHFDSRTNVKDEGRDIWVDRGAKRPGAKFIPDAPSIWSVKSGADGLKAATLKRELDPKKRADLVARLRAGDRYAYCVCRPASTRVRTTLQRTADELTRSLGVPPQAITLFFDNHLCDGLHLYGAVLRRHCPELASSCGISLREWGKASPHFDPGVGYVAFGDRGQQIERLVQHLLASEDGAVLHVAGMSGVGKTRLVYQACSDPRAPAIMYFGSYSESHAMAARVVEDERISACFVVDEVSLEHYAEIRQKLARYGKRVRVITIGPARAKEREQPGVIVLPAPDPMSEILAVLRGHAPHAVPLDALEFIAHQSGHDLRFALLMLQAVRDDRSLLSNPPAIVQALENFSGLFARIVRLFAREVDLPPDFSRVYPWLTLAANIGVAAPRRDEIEYVAKFAERTQTDIDEAVEKSVRCGLGDRPGHLFEAVPRGMATRVFADELWPRIRDRFGKMLSAVPNEAFKRAMIQRAEMCPEAVKREVTSQMDEHFRAQLGAPSLAALATRDQARTACAWAELSPTAGLSWLQQAITSAPLAELQGLQGSSKFGSEAGPRREVIWLLEKMSCFDDHYRLCEEMLFCLAVAENEDVGNNATQTWRERLRIYLSNAETPYPERVKILLARLANATEHTIDVLMAGFIQAIASPFSVFSPPTVVGGRLVPQEWRPAPGDIRELFRDTILQGLEVIRKLPAPVQRRARVQIYKELRRFYRPGTVDALKSLLDVEMDSDERLAFSAALVEFQSELAEDEEAGARDQAERVGTWLASVRPASLLERAKLVVGRSPWSYRPRGSNEHDAWKGPYTTISDELRDNLAVLEALEAWLEKAESGSQRFFGWALAERAPDGRFDSIMERWVRAGTCLTVICGFLDAWQSIHKALPEWARRTLDELVTADTKTAAIVTVHSHATKAGFERLQRCAQASLPATLPSLGKLYGGGWNDVLRPADQAWIVDQLWPAKADDRDVRGGRDALELMSMYRHQGGDTPPPTELEAVLQRVVLDPPAIETSTQAHEWGELGIWLAKRQPETVARFAARVATDFRTYRGAADGTAIAVLASMVKNRPELIAGVVLDAMLGDDFLMFETETWQSLFNAIDLTVLSAAVDARGVAAARKIGQLMPDPAIRNDGEPDLPAVTEWYLRTYGDDPKCFEEFCLGRWNGRVQSGWSWERRDQFESMARAYEKHPIKALQKWVAHQRQWLDERVKHDRVRYDESNRR